MLHCLCFSFRCRFCSDMQSCTVLYLVCRGGVKPRTYNRLPYLRLILTRHSEPVTDVTGVGIRPPFHANRRPKAATYLCRSAAKARFDNRLPRVRFPMGRAAALPFGRFKERGFLRGEGNRNPSPLKWRSLDTFFRQGKKVSRRRQKEQREGKTNKSGILHAKKAPLRVLFCFASSSIMPHQPRQQQRRQQPQQLIQHHGQRCQ